MRIYLIRHADPDYANGTITYTGHKEARVLAERLEAERIQRIYCSPMGRARHTMEYTAKRLGIKPRIEEWTQEMSEMRIGDGRRPAWDLHGEIIRDNLDKCTYTDWHRVPLLEKPMFRKKIKDLRRNSDRFIESLGYKRVGGRYRIIKRNRLRIALFCHGGFGLTWLSHLLEIPVPLMWSGFWLAASSVTTILFDERSSEWAVPRCIEMSSVSHLYKAGLPTQPRGIKANFY